MGLIRKVASIRMLGGVSGHTKREPPGKAERARTKAERAQEEAAQAQAVRAEAEAKVAEEQATALARALHEDEAHRQADLREVARKRPRPCRSGHQAPDSGTEGRAHLDGMGHHDAENDLEHASDIAGRWWADGECPGHRASVGAAPRLAACRDRSPGLHHRPLGLNRFFLRTYSAADLHRAPAVGLKDQRPHVPGAAGPHCRDMSRAVRPARSHGSDVGDQLRYAGLGLAQEQAYRVPGCRGSEVPVGLQRG